MFVAEGEKKQVKHEVCIPVRLGDTIPGYVAATKIPVNINVIKQVCNLKPYLQVLCVYMHFDIREQTSNFLRDHHSLQKVIVITVLRAYAHATLNYNYH